MNLDKKEAVSREIIRNVIRREIDDIAKELKIDPAIEKQCKLFLKDKVYDIIEIEYEKKIEKVFDKIRDFEIKMDSGKLIDEIVGKINNKQLLKYG